MLLLSNCPTRVVAKEEGGSFDVYFDVCKHKSSVQMCLSILGISYI